MSDEPQSDELQSAIGALVVESETLDYAVVGIHHRHTASLEAILELATVFFDAEYMLEMLSCQDVRAEGEALRLCYTFNSFAAVDRHLVHVDIPGGLETEVFEAPTMVSLAEGANWLEREVFDMYGVTFVGHPELERLLLPEDADFFPLRKDFGRMEDAEGADE